MVKINPNYLKIVLDKVITILYTYSMELRKKKKLILNSKEKKMEEVMIVMIMKGLTLGVLGLTFGRLLMEELTGGRR